MRFEGGQSVLQIEGQAYRLIIVFSGRTQERIYSNGVYTLKDGVMMLTPRLDWPPPEDGDGSRISYDSLTVSPFPMLVSKEKGKLIWQHPTFREAPDIYIPGTNPFLYRVEGHAAIWERLE